jgi:hypothetical protein
VNASQELAFPVSGTERIAIAKWASLEKVFLEDGRDLFKQSRLSFSAVYPNPVERQSVPLLLQVISESTIAAVELAGDVDTSAFLKYLSQFWKVTQD